MKNNTIKYLHTKDYNDCLFKFFTYTCSILSRPIYQSFIWIFFETQQKIMDIIYYTNIIIISSELNCKFNRWQVLKHGFHNGYTGDIHWKFSLYKQYVFF